MQLPVRPVISGFQPDPSVCWDGDAFYLATSSFEYAPGVPIHMSRDLRTWELVGNALDRPSQLSVGSSVPSGAIMAPTLRHHDGWFWLVTTNVADGGGHLLVTAEHASGPWSEPVRIEAGGIDPDLAWDEAGTCFFTWQGYGPEGPQGILQAVLDTATGTLSSPPVRLWQGTGGKFPEGPHLYRIGDYWYLLIAEGGTESGHSATIARSSTPSGPWEPGPGNPLLTARGTASPVQNVGHADLVQRQDGSWAAVYLGVRVRGTSPCWHVMGRETFASEVTWEDGWPVIGRPIEPEGPGSLIEELPPDHVPMTWIAPNRFPQEVLRPTERGWLLAAAASGPRAFVGRRQQHPVADITADIDAVGADGGLELRIDPRHAVQVRLADGRARAVLRLGAVETVIREAQVGDIAMLRLRIEESTGQEFSVEYGPDEIVASVVVSGTETELARIDGRYISTEVAGGMTGRIVGVVCERGEIRVASFTYRGAAVG